MGTRALDTNDFDRAESLLAKLSHRRRLYQTEFTALCVAYIQLFVAQLQVRCRSHLAFNLEERITRSSADCQIRASAGGGHWRASPPPAPMSAFFAEQP